MYVVVYAFCVHVVCSLLCVICVVGPDVRSFFVFVVLVRRSSCWCCVVFAECVLVCEVDCVYVFSVCVVVVCYVLCSCVAFVRLCVCVALCCVLLLLVCVVFVIF